MSELCKLSKRDACFVVESFVRTIDTASDKILLNKRLSDFNYYSQLLEGYSKRIDSSLSNGILNLKLTINRDCAGQSVLNNDAVSRITGWYDNFLGKIHKYIIGLPLVEQQNYSQVINVINERTKTIESNLSNLSNQMSNGFNNIEQIIHTSTSNLQKNINTLSGNQVGIRRDVNGLIIGQSHLNNQIQNIMYNNQTNQQQNMQNNNYNSNQPESLEAIIIYGKKYNLVKSEVECLKRLKKKERTMKIEIYESNSTEVPNSQNHVRKLDLSNSNLTKIPKVNNLRYLKELILYRNNIQKIENLDDLINLTSLNLSYNKIQKIEELSVLINLIGLTLDHNQIYKIENLDSLINLNLIDLSYNYIKIMEGLDNLKNLKGLYLCGNRIERVNLKGLNNIENLDLSFNQIKYISSLPYTLKVINLYGNYIENTNFLNNQHNLEEIDIYSNKLSFLEKIKLKKNKEKIRSLRY